MYPTQLIQKLENKVGVVVQLIQKLKAQNKVLMAEKKEIQDQLIQYKESVQSKLQKYEQKISDLDKLVETAQLEHTNLQKSVVHALSSFDQIEELNNDDTSNQAVQAVDRDAQKAADSTVLESNSSTEEQTDITKIDKAEPHVELSETDTKQEAIDSEIGHFSLSDEETTLENTIAAAELRNSDTTSPQYDDPAPEDIVHDKSDLDGNDTITDSSQKSDSTLDFDFDNAFIDEDGISDPNQNDNDLEILK